MEESISKKIIRNTIFNIVGRFWSILVALFLTPYIIHHIGIERYGIWALIGVLTGYFGLLDFCIGTSFVKYIAEFYARKEYEKINQVVNTGFVFYSIFAVIIIALGFFTINPLLSLVKIPSNLYNEAKFVFLVGIVIFGIFNVLSPFSAIQGGLQRMDITNKVAITVSIPNIVGTVFFLESGYGLPGLIVNNAIILALSNVINLFIAFKILPELRFNLSSFTNREMFRRLFNFGYKMEIVRVSGTVTTQIDKTLIALLLSVGLVAFYNLGYVIVSMVMSIAGLLVSALTPAFSEIEAKGERQTLINAYLRGTKYLTFVSAPVFTFLIISALQIMSIWMGLGYEKSSLIIQILSIGWMINLIAQVGASTCIAIDKPQLMATGSIITIVSNISLSILLIKVFGFSGVAWGTTFALTTGAIYFMVRLHNSLNVPVKKLIGIIIPYFVICIIATGAVFGGDVIINQFNLCISRGTALTVFLVRGLIFFSVYIMGIYYGRLFDEIDIDFFHRELPFARKLIESYSYRNARN